MSNRLPISRLDHVALRVPDPRAAADFYMRVLGLASTGQDPASGAIRLSAVPRGASEVSRHEIVLYPGEPAALEHIAFTAANGQSLAFSAGILRARGLAVEGPRAFEAVHSPAIRFRDADGYLVEIVATEAPVTRPPGGGPVDLIKLSHINIRSPEPRRAASWWQDIMDFRLSDEIPETFYWLRCNSEHSTVAIVRSNGVGVHHIGFEVASWEDIRRCGDHLAANGVKIEYGPGRHGPGNSVFLYFVDPWQIRWELLCELQRIENDGTFKPGVWDPTKGRVAAVNLWGPPPPESFMRQ